MAASTLDSAVANDKMKMRVMSGRRALKRNMDYNPQGAWHYFMA